MSGSCIARDKRKESKENSLGDSDHALDGEDWLPRRRHTTPRRKRKLSASLDQNPSLDATDEATGSSSLPPSLLPHLGWTRIAEEKCSTARRKRRRRGNNGDGGSEVDDKSGANRTVTGRAVFFFHDTRTDDDISSTNDYCEDGRDGKSDDQGIWFQGRFFPSYSPSHNSSGAVAPALTACDAADALPNGSSWGLLAVEDACVDECLRCSQGGYRELDLTVIRYVPSMTSRKKKAKRWKMNGVVWTGGDMMRLSSWSPSPVRCEGNGVTFEPTTLFVGSQALALAAKYFPSLVAQLEKQEPSKSSVLGENVAKKSFSHVMAVVGDMELAVPTAFFGRENDGMVGSETLWSDSSDEEEHNSKCGV